MSDTNFNWYAVFTKPRWEKKMAKILDHKGIENYCPVNKVVKKWSDRKKVIYEPVFKSYLFVKIKDDLKWDIKKYSGIVNFVYWLGKPAIIRESEIIRIKKFLNEFKDVIVVEDQSMSVNDKVRVTQGLLMDYEGLVVEIHGSKAKIKIESLGVFLSADIDKKHLAVLDNPAVKNSK